jgi:outer membrane protein
MYFTGRTQSKHQKGGYIMKCRNIGRWLTVAACGVLVSLGVFSHAAEAEEFKNIGLRIRALAVIPDEKVDDRLSSLNIEVKSNLTPEVDIEYFFTRNFSTELIAAVTKHELVTNGRTLGSTWLLPPSLTFKYHPLPDLKVSPYVGFGINYVIPFNDKADGVMNVTDFHISSSVGWTAQAGADYSLGNNWYLNLDFKFAKVDTDMRINGVKYKLDINPYIIGTGVGYRF